MTYLVRVRSSALRALSRLPRAEQVRIHAHVEALAEQPRPPGAKKLSAAEGLWRVRVGDYRIIYRIEDRALIVLVVRIAPRHDAYSGL